MSRVTKPIDRAAAQAALRERAARISAAAFRLAKQADKLAADAQKLSDAHDRQISETFIGRHDGSWNAFTTTTPADTIVRAAEQYRNMAEAR